jgi:hypothetical protein
MRPRARIGLAKKINSARNLRGQNLCKNTHALLGLFQSPIGITIQTSTLIFFHSVLYIKLQSIY